MAISSAQGIFVAPKTRIPSESFPTPFICTRNSVLIRLDASDSPSPRVPASESISSTKMIAGLFSRAIWKSCFTSLCVPRQIISSATKATTDLSDSPIHLLTRSEELTLKKVLFASVATAFAKKLFPVPGGP